MHYAKIKSIENIGKDETFDLKVYPNHNFFLSNGILTHNSGKSTLAIHLAKKGCIWFKIKDDIIFSRKELIEKISNAEKKSYIVLDEAINVLFKRDFMDRKQKFILKLLDMCRDRNLCLIMCVPNFWAIDKHILEGRIRLRIHVARTGFSFMWKPTTNPFTPDKWNRKYNEQVCYNWDTYPNAKKTKGFIGYLKFGDLCDSDRKDYLAVKEYKKEMIKKEEEEEDKKQELDKQKGFIMGETMVLSMLKEQGLLKKGAFNIYASIRGENPSAIMKRVQRYSKKNGQDTSDNDINYKYDVNNDVIGGNQI
jgi:hypothetical protein